MSQNTCGEKLFYVLPTSLTVCHYPLSTIRLLYNFFGGGSSFYYSTKGVRLHLFCSPEVMYMENYLIRPSGASLLDTLRKGYRCYCPVEKKTYISKDVIF